MCAPVITKLQALQPLAVVPVPVALSGSFASGSAALTLWQPVAGSAGHGAGGSTASTSASASE